MSGRRARPEEKSSALAMYANGVFITEIAQRTGFGTTTIFRWAQEAGIAKSFSERLVSGSKSRQFGRECIGKKGAFHTTKGKVWIHTDSTYEYARLEQLESTESVAKIARCSHRIPYEFGGRKHNYIPDFQIEYADGSVVVEEVKPKHWALDPKVLMKVAAALTFYAGSNVTYRVVTEIDIGIDRIKAATLVAESRMNAEHQAAYAERRRRQKAAAQRQYEKRRKAESSPEQLSEFRSKMAAFQRKYRSERVKKAS